MIDEILKVVKIDLGQGTQSVQEYQKALDSAANSADNLNDELGDLKKTSDGGILKGITAGFDEAVDATLGEIGKLDAEVAGLGYKIKDFAKVFKAFTTTAISGMNGLKLAIAGTGIGLLIIAAGTLYARWEDFKEAVGLSGETFEKFKTKAIGVLKDIVGGVVALGSAIGSAIVGGVKLAYTTIKDFGKEVTKLFKGLFDALANPSNFTKIANNAVNAFTSTMKSSLSKSSKDLVDSVTDQWDKGFTAGADMIDKLLTDKVEETGEKVKAKAIQKSKEIQEALLKQTIEGIQYRYDYQQKWEEASLDDEATKNQKLYDLQQQSYNEQLAAYDNYLANRNLSDEERAQAELDRQKLLDQQKLDQWKYANDQQKAAEDQAKLAEEEQRKADEEELKVEEDLARQAQANSENIWYQGSYNKYLNYLSQRKEALKNELDNFKGTQADKEKLEKKYTDVCEKESKARDKRDEVEAKNKKARAKFTANFLINQSASIFGSMSEIFGKESAAGKAFAIAQATIDTFKSANSAYSAMAGIPIVGPALGIAAAAAAIASGIANVKNILSVDAGDENSIPGTTTSTPTPSTPASVATPTVAVPEMEQIGVTPLIDEYRDLQRMQSITVGGDAGTRVYVLEEDIRNVGNRVQVRENEASF